MDTFQYLAELGVSWSTSYIETRSADSPYFNRYPYRHLLSSYAQVISAGDINHTFEGDQTLVSVFLHATEQFRHSLRFFSGDIKYDFLLFGVADWPEGLKLLIKHGIDASSKEYALDCACFLGNADCVKILLKAGAKICRSTWGCALEREYDEIKLLIAQEIIRRTASPALVDPELADTIYHADLTSEDANMLYVLGFTNLDSVWDGRTLLVFHSFELEMNCFYRKFRLMKWFMDKGAKFDQEHWEGGWCTTPSLAITDLATKCLWTALFVYSDGWFRCDDQVLKRLCECCELQTLDHICNCYSPANLDDLLRSTGSIYSRPQVDRCRCACSGAGCLPMARLMNIPPQRFGSKDSLDFGLRCALRRAMLDFLFGKMQAHASPFMMIEMVRTITFNELDLTHTCHYVEDWPHLSRLRYTQSAIDDIHYSEQKDITLLDQLMEEFESVWELQQNTLQDFLDGYWTQRMEEIHAERAAVPDEGIEQLKELGVSFHEGKEEDTKVIQLYQKRTPEEWLLEFCEDIREVTGFDDLVDEFMAEKGIVPFPRISTVED
jgi:hypothetical protein